jgi:ABC-type polar amino acid transport system ATPase subunit
MTGRSATGKSTFINTIRNLKPGDDGFAMAGSGDTTITPKDICSRFVSTIL